MNTKVNNERQGSAFKLSLAKFDTDTSTRTTSPIRVNKRFIAHGSTKSQHKSNNIDNMDSDTDHIVANFKQTVCQLISTICF